MLLSAARGATAQELLRIRWDFMVTTMDLSPTEGTSVRPTRTALPISEAFRRIAGTDPRPLLVLRECPICNKTDNALLRPGADNERTIVLSRWFHCVKLPVDVIAPDEPFHALFPRNDSEHFFVSMVDGSGRIPLEADTSRTELWASMSKVLARSYQKDPEGIVQEILKLHGKLDVLDARLSVLMRDRNAIVEEPGRQDKEKLKKIDKELQATRKELDEQLQAIERLSKLEPKPSQKV